MHASQPVGDTWPSAPIGSLRVWDAGVAWNQVEKTPGTYDWSRLDEIVKTARDHHAQLLIVLGQTPAFHSRHPKKVGAYGPSDGCSDETQSGPTGRVPPRCPTWRPGRRT